MNQLLLHHPTGHDRIRTANPAPRLPPNRILVFPDSGHSSKGSDPFGLSKKS